MDVINVFETTVSFFVTNTMYLCFQITDVNVDVKSPLIIIPEQGIFEK